MTVWFVSRHQGAIEWVGGQGLVVDRWVPHLDVACIQPGDTVVGTLPVHVAARVCGRGASYLHLSLDLPEHLRGQELSASDLAQAGARMEPFDVRTSSPTR